MWGEITHFWSIFDWFNICLGGANFYNVNIFYSFFDSPVLKHWKLMLSFPFNRTSFQLYNWPNQPKATPIFIDSVYQFLLATLVLSYAWSPCRSFLQIYSWQLKPIQITIYTDLKINFDHTSQTLHKGLLVVLGSWRWRGSLLCTSFEQGVCKNVWKTFF